MEIKHIKSAEHNTDKLTFKIYDKETGKEILPDCKAELEDYVELDIMYVDGKYEVGLWLRCDVKDIKFIESMRERDKC